MSTITDSNIFTVEDIDALNSLPTGVVLVELPRDPKEAQQHGETVDFFWTVETCEGAMFRRLRDGVYDSPQPRKWLFTPLRVVNPEVLGITEADVVGFSPVVTVQNAVVGETLVLVDDSSFAAKAGSLAVVTGTNGRWITVDWLPENGLSGRQMNGSYSPVAFERVPVEVEVEEEPLTDWEIELLDGPDPKAEPGVAMVVVFAMVGN